MEITEATIIIHRIIIQPTMAAVIAPIGGMDGRSKSFITISISTFTIITTVHVNSNICKRDTYDIHIGYNRHVFARVHTDTYTKERTDSITYKRITFADCLYTTIF